MECARVFVYWLTTAIAAFLTGACNADADLVDHSFEFDAFQDSPGIEILDYRYGDTKAAGARNPDYMIKEGRSHQRTSVTGFMKRADSLYVRWRTRTNGEVHEDTVDLRSRLPKDLKDWTVYFIVKNAQLHVYLISSNPRPLNTEPIGPTVYRDRKVIEIYPE